MALTGELFDLQSGRFRAAVSEVGGGLAGLWLDGRPLTAPWAAGALPAMSSGAVLMPWPNRVRAGRYDFDGAEYQLPLTEPANGNAIHGLVRWVRWVVTQSSDEALTLTHDLVPQPGYPFELSLEIRYTLSAETGLTVQVGATNRGVATAPFGVGFHPYLDLNGAELDSALLEIPAASVYHVDAAQIPVGKSSVSGTPLDLRSRTELGTRRLDHGFTDLAGSRATVQVGDDRTELWWSPEFGNLQVFTPAPSRLGRTAIAIEPMTCAADAFNSRDGLISLGSGASWRGAWGISAT